ncbi:uncharacterized protein B0I36DRAFT_360716 [Microdochium trichocladiopsis]|uniref:Microbial-type PARG catalytic domain-containing protein n=1 Tax=Microdochium trichocladiopsis TaxID=1682393 RepID=A0A9P8YE19_9PEZI|nr:uncharacterized protein B0I36DRAFT_360716 [Microdochium trichocladiopsis]KAH7035328.1 hypothetical protein B0I36DRAFT_360716 [Microdochium trichocladiopsis]
MGRTEPSLGRPPPEFRRDARAKRAKATVNKLIPALLNAHPRARRGIDAAELIVEPAAATTARTTTSTVETTKFKDAKQPAPNGSSRSSGKGKAKGRKGKGRGHGDNEEELTAPERPGAATGPALPDVAPGSKSRPDKTANPASATPPRIRLAIADTLTVARYLLEPAGDDACGATASAAKPTKTTRADLANTTSRVGILNMASPLSPGGGFLNGAMTQEESLCMRTTLLPSLRDEFYRLPELGAVYTPDVLVFRDEAGNDLDKKDRWFVDCVSAAMLRFPEVEEVPDGDDGGVKSTTDQPRTSPENDLDSNSDEEEEGEEEDEDGDEDIHEALVIKRYANQKDREAVIHKMRVVMRIFQAKGCRKLVLGGAWGCGAYGNPVEEVAAAWRKVLLPPTPSSNKAGGSGRARPPKENWHGIEEVVFAIKGGGMAGRFENAFLGSSATAPPPLPAAEHAHGSAGGELSAIPGTIDQISPTVLSQFTSLARPPSSTHGGGGDSQGQAPEEDPEAFRMRELRERIATLDLQVRQARTEQLRNGLSAVLAGLRSQLPPHERLSDAGAEEQEELSKEEEDDDDNEEDRGSDDDDDEADGRDGLSTGDEDGDINRGGVSHR